MANRKEWPLLLFAIRHSLLALSTLAPDELRSDHVIPNNAHDGASKSGDPPDVLRAEDPVADPDIGHRADGGDHVEAHQPGDKSPTRTPLIAIGEGVVEREIGSDGHNRCHGLRPGEIQ